MPVLVVMNCCAERLAADRVVERRVREVVRDVGRLDLDVRVDRLGAELVALDVADARRAQRGAADGADGAGLADRRGDDAGEVAGLVLLEVDRDVVRQRGSSRRPCRRTSESGAPVSSTQIGDWSTPTNQIFGLACAARVVAAPRLKPTVTMMLKPWSTNAWMFLAYSDASFGTTDGGVGGADRGGAGLSALVRVLVEVLVVERADVGRRRRS